MSGLSPTIGHDNSDSDQPPRRLAGRPPSRRRQGRQSGSGLNASKQPLPQPWVWAGAGTNTAFVGPWGTSYTANLTPDRLTGLGIWTEEMFVKTLRTGRHWGTARPIAPPMPWQAFRNATDEDLKSIFAYLHSIPPIANEVPQYEPPAPAAEKKSSKS